MPTMRIEPTDALIIVDVQRDFCPGGALPVPEGDEVVAPLNAAAGRFRTVVTSQDWHPADHCSFQPQGGPWPVHCVQGTPGAELHPDLNTDLVTHSVKKGTAADREAYSAFHGEPGLAALLRGAGATRVFIGGLATDYCVKETVLGALKNGFPAVVLRDAVRAVNIAPDDGETALREMAAAGAEVLTTGDLE